MGFATLFVVVVVVVCVAVLAVTTQTHVRDVRRSLELIDAMLPFFRHSHAQPNGAQRRDVTRQLELERKRLRGWLHETTR